MQKHKKYKYQRDVLQGKILGRDIDEKLFFGSSDFRYLGEYNISVSENFIFKQSDLRYIKQQRL